LKVMVITPASVWVRMSDMVFLLVCSQSERAYCTRIQVCVRPSMGEPM
jgi:hypothetical protein